MSERIPEHHPFTAASPVYFRTPTGTRVHLPHCPHLTGFDVHPATAAERLAHPVCNWSQAQLEGHGREDFDDLDDAMRRIRVPVEAHDAILTALRFVDHDEVFVVHSLTYGALGRDGVIVASFGKHHYWVGDRRVNLPSYVDSSRGGHTEDRPYGDLCPVHHLTMALNGTCDDC